MTADRQDVELGAPPAHQPALAPSSVQSRQLHETGFRHIGNKERHLRNIYKTGEKKKRDADEEKREIDRLEKVSPGPLVFASMAGRSGPSAPCQRESLCQSRDFRADSFLPSSVLCQAAARAYALDLASGSGSPSSAPPPPKAVEPPKPKDKFAGYTTAADLGFIDPDVPEPVDTAAEEAAAQAKLEGRVGEWSFVAAPSPPPPEPETAEVKRHALGAFAGLSAVPKGEHDDDAKEHREFKFVRKEKRPLNWGADDDEGEIKVKVKEKEEGLMAKKRKKEEEDEAAKVAREKLVWKPVAWGSKLGQAGAAAAETQEEVKTEAEVVPEVKEEPIPAVVEEEKKPEVDVPPAPAASLFKKRRGPPAGVGKKPKF